jgi:hypothetical protein
MPVAGLFAFLCRVSPFLGAVQRPNLSKFPFSLSRAESCQHLLSYGT